MLFAVTVNASDEEKVKGSLKACASNINTVSQEMEDIDMADIKEYTDKIRKAVYGEEVRGSIVNAIEAMNTQNNGLVKEVEDKAKELIPHDYSGVVAEQSRLSESILEISGHVNDVESDLENSFTYSGYNIFNPSKITVSNVDLDWQGNETANNNRRTSDFINISKYAGQKLYCYAENGTPAYLYYVVVYDSNKKRIAAEGAYVRNVALGAKAHYIRVVFDSTDDNVFAKRMLTNLDSVDKFYPYTDAPYDISNMQTVKDIRREIAESANNSKKTYFDTAIESVVGFYDVDANFQGAGTRIKSIHSFDKIVARFRTNKSGTAYCEILDDDMNVLKKVVSSVTPDTNVVFNLEGFHTNNDSVWVRFYGDDGVIPKRSEVNLANKNMISKLDNNEYHMFMNSNRTWMKTTASAYCIPFEVFGSVASRSVSVGSKGAFEKLKEAIDYVSLYPNFEWDVYVTDGTYNLYDEFGGDSWYRAITSEKGNMQGLTLPNNCNLIGEGNVTITLIAPDSLATTSTVPNLSVIELPYKNNVLKNLTIKGKNVRYVVHDETDGKQTNSTRLFENCTLEHQGVKSGTWESPASYGCGSSDGAIFEYKNCVFNKWLAHQNASQTIPPHFIANNCTFDGGAYAISLNTSGDCKADITFNGCTINYMVRILEDKNIWTMYGSGNNDFNYVVIGDVYNQLCNKLSDKAYIRKASTNIQRLSPVTVGTDGKLQLAHNANDCIGILINGVDTSENGVVIKNGYVNVYTFSPFSNGDLIGVGSNGTLVVDNENPIAKAVTVDGIQQIYVF